MADIDERMKEEQERKKHEREVQHAQAREAVRKALIHYEALLDVAQSTEQNDKKRDHFFSSHVQVLSAKRVLWMD